MQSALITMTPEDVELVKLARDTVVMVAASTGRIVPTLDASPSSCQGYAHRLGKYMESAGPVFTRISKRELIDGEPHNRNRGCECVGLLKATRLSYAESTIQSAAHSALQARRVGPGPKRNHKPIWPGEVGSLSLFLFIVEGFLRTKSLTAQALIDEGHDPIRYGLMAIGPRGNAVLTADLEGIDTVEKQLKAVTQKMQMLRDHGFPYPSQVDHFLRMKGRWIWDPSRPRHTHF